MIQFPVTEDSYKIIIRFSWKLLVRCLGKIWIHCTIFLFSDTRLIGILNSAVQLFSKDFFDFIWSAVNDFSFQTQYKDSEESILAIILS